MPIDHLNELDRNEDNNNTIESGEMLNILSDQEKITTLKDDETAFSEKLTSLEEGTVKNEFISLCKESLVQYYGKQGRLNGPDIWEAKINAFNDTNKLSTHLDPDYSLIFMMKQLGVTKEDFAALATEHTVTTEKKEEENEGTITVNTSLETQTLGKLSLTQEPNLGIENMKMDAATHSINLTHKGVNFLFPNLHELAVDNMYITQTGLKLKKNDDSSLHFSYEKNHDTTTGQNTAKEQTKTMDTNKGNTDTTENLGAKENLESLFVGSSIGESMHNIGSAINKKIDASTNENIKNNVNKSLEQIASEYINGIGEHIQTFSKLDDKELTKTNVSNILEDIYSLPKETITKTKALNTKHKLGVEESVFVDAEKVINDAIKNMHNTINTMDQQTFVDQATGARDKFANKDMQALMQDVESTFVDNSARKDIALNEKIDVTEEPEKSKELIDFTNKLDTTDNTEELISVIKNINVKNIDKKEKESYGNAIEDAVKNNPNLSMAIKDRKDSGDTILDNIQNNNHRKTINLKRTLGKKNIKEIAQKRSRSEGFEGTSTRESQRILKNTSKIMNIKHGILEHPQAKIVAEENYYIKEFTGDGEFKLYEVKGKDIVKGFDIQGKLVEKKVTTNTKKTSSTKQTTFS